MACLSSPRPGLNSKRMSFNSFLPFLKGEAHIKTRRQVFIFRVKGQGSRVKETVWMEALRQGVRTLRTLSWFITPSAGLDWTRVCLGLKHGAGRSRWSPSGLSVPGTEDDGQWVGPGSGPCGKYQGNNNINNISNSTRVDCTPTGKKYGSCLSTDLFA